MPASVLQLQALPYSSYTDLPRKSGIGAKTYNSRASSLQEMIRWKMLGNWSERRGMIPQHYPWQGYTLPVELLSHINFLGADRGN